MQEKKKKLEQVFIENLPSARHSSLRIQPSRLESKVPLGGFVLAGEKKKINKSKILFFFFFFFFFAVLRDEPRASLW
jgi:hypothetical protein